MQTLTGLFPVVFTHSNPLSILQLEHPSSSTVLPSSHSSKSGDVDCKVPLPQFNVHGGVYKLSQEYNGSI